jgi:hypothetical protein
VQDTRVWLKMMGCRGLNRDNLGTAIVVLFDHGFVADQNVGDRMRGVRKKSEIPGLVAAHGIDYPARRKGGVARWTWACPAYPTHLDGFDNSIFSFELKNDTGTLLLSGLVPVELAERYAQILRGVAVELFPLALPQLGWIDTSNSTDERDVARTRLRVVSWLNMWGPSYLSAHGEGVLAGVPGVVTQSVPGAGLVHQVSREMFTADRRKTREIRQSVVDHFAAHELTVKCQAPCVLPRSAMAAAASEAGVTGREAAMTDTTLVFYLKEMLGTTLVLTDGTRVKHLLLEWTALSPRQQRRAVEIIKNIVDLELRQIGDTARLRLEFNEIPDDLDEALRGLVVPVAGHVEWVRVTTG